MYHEGDGGTVSYEHAMFWLKRAAAEGFNDALQALQEMKSTCFSCGKRSAKGQLNMKKCIGCKCAIYCSKGCQLAHWKKNGGHHKTMCKKIQALKLKMAGDANGSSVSAGGGAGESKTNGGGGGAGAPTKKKTKKKKTKEEKKKLLRHSV